MIESKDALALALFKQYQGIYSPKLRLTDKNVDDLLEYLQAIPPVAQHAP